MAYWNATAAPADQYASVVCTAGSFPGVLVRHQPGVSSFYFCFRNSGGGGGPWLYRSDNGSFQLLTSTLGSPMNLGDTLRLQATGSTLEVFVNGVSRGTFVDATYASGQPGIALQTATVDDFDAGPFATATVWPATAGLAGSGVLRAAPALQMAARALWASGGTLTASLAQTAALAAYWGGAGALVAALTQTAALGARWGGAGTLSVPLRQTAQGSARWGGVGGLSVDAAVFQAAPNRPPTATLQGRQPDPLHITAVGSGPLTITGHR